MLNTYFFLQNSCKTQTKRSSTSSLQAVVCCQNVPPLKVVVFANTHLLLSASGAVCWRCGRRRRPRRLQNLLSTSPWRRRRSRSCWTDVRALQRPWKHKNDVIFKFPSFFFIFRHFNTVDSKKQYELLLMTGFKLRISGIGSDRSTNWATTTAHQWKLFVGAKIIKMNAARLGFWPTFMATAFKLKVMISKLSFL